MNSGYVANISDSTIESFFADFDVDIHSDKYTVIGTLKAKKLRQFCELKPDHLVGPTIAPLVKHTKESPHPFYPTSEAEKMTLINDCKAIASHLTAGEVDLGHLKKATAYFVTKHLARQIHRIERSIESDPALAIESAKELIETCYKTILATWGKPVTGTPGIPTLTKITLRELNSFPKASMRPHVERTC